MASLPRACTYPSTDLARRAVIRCGPTLGAMVPNGDSPGQSLHDRRVTAALAGHSGDQQAAITSTLDPDPSVRLLGFGALARLEILSTQLALTGLADPDSRVVRRVIEAVARLHPVSPESEGPNTEMKGSIDPIDDRLVELLAGADDVIAEVAAWALGERYQQCDVDAVNDPESQQACLTPRSVVDALRAAATGHTDALVRESSAAALGAIGDGLDAILKATTDKATVRRRAVLALASFDGAEVNAALERARNDRDWQVRQAAEDLLRDG
jgi:HEAT repeat protein